MSPRSKIIGALRPFLSDRRAARIEKVIANRLTGVTVVLEALYDHGNIVAVMRTAEALGLSQCHIIGEWTKFKTAKKVGQGAQKWLEAFEHSSPAAAVADLHSRGFRILGSDLNASQTLDEIDVTSPFALVFGNEHAGVSETLLELCDETFYIPMVGFSQSLNISCAAAITLYEVARRYRAALGAPSDLSSDDQARLRADFYRRAVKNSEIYLDPE